MRRFHPACHVVANDLGLSFGYAPGSEFGHERRLHVLFNHAREHDLLMRRAASQQDRLRLGIGLFGLIDVDVSRFATMRYVKSFEI